MDTHFSALRQQGVGAQVNHAKLLTPDEENLVWQMGVMGTDTPRALLQAVFFYKGKKFFLLREREENRGLNFS